MYDNRSCYIQNDNIEIKMVADTSIIRLVLHQKHVLPVDNYMIPFYYARLPLKRIRKFITDQKDEDFEIYLFVPEEPSPQEQEQSNEPPYITKVSKPKRIRRLTFKMQAQVLALETVDDEKLEIPLQDKHWSELKEYFANLSRKG